MTPSFTGQSAAGHAKCPSAMASALCTALFWGFMCRWALCAAAFNRPCRLAASTFATLLEVQAVPMLFVWETKRKDRLEVLAHHVATIVLIAYSYYLK